MAHTQKELKERKDRVLSVTIEQYINSVTPVSSTFIAQESALDLSSATIRNILADLEEDGLLTHPHTSAGRVPTQRGYRYYVDHLMNQIQILEDEKARIKEEYKRESLELESLLDRVSRTISDRTHYTSIISIDGSDSKIFCQGTNFVVNYPDTNDILKIQSILEALDRKETLLKVINQDLEQKVNIYIGQEIACQQIDSCSLVVSPYQTRKGPSGRIAVLGPTRMHYENVVATLDYFSHLIEELF